MKVNFLYPIFVGFLMGCRGDEEVKLLGYLRTEIDTQYYFGYITLFIGNPPQKVTALLNAQESALIVLDVDCMEKAMKRKSECKRYCEDGKFCSIHCHPLCCESQQRLKILCYNRTKLAYNRTASRTFHLPVKNPTVWKSEYEGYRKLYGEYVRDGIGLLGLGGGENSKMYMENTTFVSGWLTDPRMFFMNSAIFGFSPRIKDGIEPLILHAYKQKLIKLPYLSLVYRTYALNGALTLGAEEPTYCKPEWTYHKAKNEEWILNAKSFEFNDITYEKEVEIFTQPYEQMLWVPDYLIQSMIDEGTLIFYQDDYIIDCNSQLTLSFVIDSKIYTLGATELVDVDPWEHYGNCVARIRPIKHKRYVNNADFILGMPWFFKYCHTFDYRDLRIGLSEMRTDTAY